MYLVIKYEHPTIKNGRNLNELSVCVLPDSVLPRHADGGNASFTLGVKYLRATFNDKSG